jgi:glycosyltransferase involved in cell wall biosynthesis
MKRICFVVSSEMTIKAFLIDQLRALSAQHKLCVVANTTDQNLLAAYGIDAEVRPVAIERKIDLLRDLGALWSLWRFLRANRFDAVHSVTPKAGLLGMLASLAAGVPTRIHMFTGQVWATRTGASRWFLKALDCLTARMATHALADSPSQRDFLIQEKVVPIERISVLGDGSISGVDLRRFKPDPETRRAVRSELQIPMESLVLLYVGRLTRDKGLLDLAGAFAAVSQEQPEAHLLLVGPDEQEMTPQIRKICGTCSSRLHLVPFTPAPERYMAASDVLCLPSYREGFGGVIIEAAAVGLPSMASRIYGITDAVVDGVTGILHEARNTAQIAEVMTRLAADPALRLSLAERAQSRAREKFSKERVTGAVVEFYRDVLMEDVRSPGTGVV